MTRFELVRIGSAASTIADDVRAGLSREPKSIPPKHFYDDVGASLFDRICELPEYYLTRAEGALLARTAGSIAAATRADVLVELGSGMARKTGLLLDALGTVGDALTYVPLDVSEASLRHSAEALLPTRPTLRVRAVLGDFSGRLAPTRVTDGARHLFAFLGSTVGNLDEVEAPALVRRVADAMTADDAFLLGVDLDKDPELLRVAYDDSAGVTAAFNKNVLTVVNRELAADFDVEAFAHEARYDVPRRRIEMHLRSLRPQTVALAALDLRVRFSAGERMLTEISRKFTRSDVEATLAAGGMRLVEWLEEPGVFALALARLR